MKESDSFYKEDIEKISLNFSELRKKGLSYVQELSGDVWTDFNAHDPGVTILEQLCYALTDVTYRTDYPINDLLFGKKNKLISAKKNAFFEPSNIYKSHPVTIADTRKLLIDQFDEIQNVWITTMDNTGFEEKLIVTEKIEILPKYIFSEALKGRPDQQDKFIQRVKKFIDRNRNIGEDVEQICLLKPLNITIEFSVYLNEHKNLEKALAHVLLDLFEYLYCPVPKFNLQEMLDDNYEVSEIFSGPELSKGFIKTTSLQERITEIDVNKMQQLLSKSNAVYKCDVSSIYCDSTAHKYLKVKDGYFFHLLNDEPNELKHDVAFESIFEHMTVKINNKIKELTALNEQEIHRVFYELWAKKYRQYSIEASEGDFFDKKLEGTVRNPEDYFSLQHHFPQIYGIGRDGIPKSEPKERHAKAQQLKAYLLFFEQHLANHLSQISHVDEFFNIDYSNGSKQTYFTQHVSSVNDIERIHPSTTFDLDACVYHKTPQRKYVFANIDTMKLSDLNKEKKIVLLKRILTEQQLFEAYLVKTKKKKLPEELLYGSLRINNYVEILHKLKFNWLDEKTKENFWASVVLSFVILTKVEAKYFAPIVFIETFSLHLIKMLTAIGKGNLMNNLISEIKLLQPHFKKKRPYFLEFIELWKQAELKKKEHDFFNRKNRIYDHLIARFGEEFNSLPWEVSRQLNVIKSEAEYHDELLKQKSNFLMNIEALSANTLKGEVIYWDAKKGQISRELSELENMILAKTGITSREELNGKSRTTENEQCETFYVVDHILLRTFLNEPKISYGFKIVDEIDRELIKNDTWYELEKDRDEALIELIQELKLKEDSDLREAGYLFDQNLVTNGRTRLEAVEKIRAKGTKDYKRGKYGQKRLIFRRKLNEDTSSKKSKESENVLIIDEDFFNLSISVVFPNWPLRYQNEHFKTYVEDLICERVPSHIAVNIYWIGKNKMKSFEKDYLNWEQLRAKTTDDLTDYKKASYQVYNMMMNLR